MSDNDNYKLQIEFFQEHGYLHLKRFLPRIVLDGLQSFLEKWVEHQISIWQSERLISTDCFGLDFRTRLYTAWTASNRPKLITTDIKERFCTQAIFNFGMQQELLGLVRDLLETNDISPDERSFFRAKLPQQDYTSIPWHQDAQCINVHGDHADFVTLWIPLVNIDESNSCLEIAKALPQRGIYKSCIPRGSSYVGMHECDVAELADVRRVTMQRGDILCMHKFLPHRSLDNDTNEIRWSVDLRYKKDQGRYGYTKY